MRRYNSLVYELYKSQGGSFFGCADGEFPDASVLLYEKDTPILAGWRLEPAGRATTLFFTAQTGAELAGRLCLSLSKQNAFNKSLDLLFKEDIEVGDEELDRRYMIRSDSPDLARRIFLDVELRRLLLGPSHFSAEVAPAADQEGLHYFRVFKKFKYYPLAEFNPSETEEALPGAIIRVCRALFEAVTAVVR